MNFFDHTQNLHPAQSTTPGVQADAAKDTTKAKDAAKKGRAHRLQHARKLARTRRGEHAPGKALRSPAARTATADEPQWAPTPRGNQESREG